MSNLAERLAQELEQSIVRVAADLAVEREDFLRANRLIDAASAARLLAVPESWVRENANSGELPAIRLGKYLRFHPAEIIRWALARQKEA